MDFSNRNVQSNQPPAPAAHHAAPPVNAGRRKSDRGKLSRIGAMSMLAAIVILIVAVILLIASGPKSEDSYVDTGKLQAVFLNTGQVYFGNVKAMNDKYFVLTNIYYLQTANSGSSSSSSSANTNVTLVKLGCELHEPYDQMVINRTSVTFWENLQDGGQVAKAVATFQKNNPQGQKCSDQSSSSSTGSSNAVQSAGGSSTPSTTPTTTNNSTTTKP